MGLLAGISSPLDVKALAARQIPALAAEIRSFLVGNVSRTGGHLGPNLGVVELTIAVHRVFDSPRDTIIFDTGHQAYVHKLLTGRKDFTALRHLGGLSGYPSRAESAHDVVENSHASTALSWADGVAKAYEVRGIKDRRVVAIVGDGALTGGMAWEALNNIAESDRRVVIVVNDNGRSYSPTIGGLANHLDTLRTTRGYEQFLKWGERTLKRSGPPGRLAFQALHGLKKGLRDVVMPQGMFEDLGIKYIGPVDGHDEPAVERALELARSYRGPVIVHTITVKGRGYAPAEQDMADRFHAVGQIHPETGLPVAPSHFGWTAVFADEIVAIGRRRADVVCITAAMLAPVGLAPFARQFPGRVFDVGIAEQHAVASAAGMAFAGLHPVVCMYSTFLGRAFDQVLMDVALHHAGVTFVLDRSGITGEDGPSHNGMWDMALLRVVPGLRLAAPRDEATLREALRDAVDVSDAPTVVRYPKGALAEPTPAIRELDGVDIVAEYDGDAAAGRQARRVLIVGVGPMVSTAIATGEALAAHGIKVTVATRTWILPISSTLVKLASDADVVLTVEDGVVAGGVGAALAQAAAEQGVLTPYIHHGIPDRFISQASREEIIAASRLTAADATRDVLDALALL